MLLIECEKAGRFLDLVQVYNLYFQLVNSLRFRVKNREDIITLLKSNNITATAPRIEIAQILFARKQHLSAEHILKILNAQGSLVSKATIYNTLGLLVEKELLREVIVDPSKVFYDSNISNHFHFFNTDTGELTDISQDKVHMDRLPELPEGTVSAGVDVIVRVKNS